MKNQEFNYMLLSRLQMDVEYFLNYGNGCEKHLFYGDIKKHIAEMINLWKILPEKPIWLRAVDLVNYKKKCLCN